MAKVKKIEHIHEGKKWHHDQYMIYCEGCKCEHAIELKSEGGNHTFNGDMENPTFDPSLLCDWMPDRVCHSWIRDGKIQYLGDCFHDLKNQTIDLPEIK